MGNRKIIGAGAAALLTAGLLAHYLFGHALIWAGMPKTEGRGAPEPYTNMPCMMFNDTYVVHLASYVATENVDPEARRSKVFKPYCQTLPETGRLAFAIDLMDKEIRKLPISVAFFRGAAPSGAAMRDQPARPYPAGLIELSAEVSEPGPYVLRLMFGEGAKPDDTLLIPIAVGGK